MSLNCLECHAGRFDGELVIGLGRADVDYTQDLGQLFGGIAVPEIPIPGLDELTRFIQRYQVIGPDIVMYTVGTNPADEVAVILASHRDRDTLAWHDEESMPVPDLVAPVDTPPWWRTKKKNGLFYNGMARGDHRGTMMFASSLCTDSVDEAASILAYFNNVRAYIASLEAPKYPFAIDAAARRRGAGRCSGPTARGATAPTAPATTRTPTRTSSSTWTSSGPIRWSPPSRTPRRCIEWFDESFYGQTTQLVTDDPLGRVHRAAARRDLGDGAVSAQRIGADARAGARQQRDGRTRGSGWISTARTSTRQAVGWPFVELPYGWDDAPDGERKFVYDTGKLGHWNTGHTFGDHLSDPERRAVLEYLKTL